MNGAGAQFLYDGHDLAAEIGGGAVGASYVRSLNIDEPFIRKGVTGNEFFHTDALGSSLVLSNAQGASSTTYTYKPFGKTTVTGTSANALQYTGRENDGTGLHNYRARYYQPRLQRFMAEDPLGFSGGSDFYAYVSNNPVNWVDPFGLETRVVIGRDTIRGTGIGIGHVGVYVDHGIDGGRTIYDPAGSFQQDTRGSGGTLNGPDANWPRYLKYQKQGAEVDVFIFPTTPEQELEIAMRADRIGDPRGLSCTISVSQALQGIGPFKNVTPTWFPGRFRSQLRQIQRR